MSNEQHSNVPESIARDDEGPKLLVLDYPLLTKIKEESDKNTELGLSKLDAVGAFNKINAREDIKKARKADADAALSKDEKTNDPSERLRIEAISSRLYTLQNLGKALEKAIGTFDGKSAKGVRQTFSLFLNLPYDPSDLSKVDLVFNNSWRNSEQFPQGLNTDEGLVKIAQSLAPEIQAMLTEENVSWEELTKGNPEVAKLFAPQLRAEKTVQEPALDMTNEKSVSRAQAREFKTLIDGLKKQGFNLVAEAGSKNDDVLSKAFDYEHLGTLARYVGSPEKVSDDELASALEKAFQGSTNSFNETLKDVIAGAKALNPEKTLNPYELEASTKLVELAKEVETSNGADGRIASR